MIDNETQQTPQPRDPVSQAETATIIADALGETEFSPRANIGRIVQALGRTQSRELLSKTLEIEANGGILVPDGSRRRTPGGVFFHLAYTTGQPKPGKTLQRPQDRVKKPKNGDAQSAQANDTPKAQKAVGKSAQQQTAIVFSWSDRIAIVNEASKEKGTANVKITLVGRPGKIIDKGQFVMTIMESSKVPMLPKGLPMPTNMATKYAVYIATKQWNKVKDAIRDPEDTLIIEGFPKIDAEVGAIAVFASNITTKKQQMAKKQPQQASGS
jgi:hypothetical protein